MTILLVIFVSLLLSRIVRRDVRTSQEFETDGCKYLIIIQ